MPFKHNKKETVYFGSEFESVLYHHGGDGMVSRQALAVVLEFRQVIILNLQSETREMNARTQFFFLFSPFYSVWTPAP